MSCIESHGLTFYGCTGTLTIGSTLLNCPAWDIPDLTTLWIEAAQRGQDRLLPGTAGVIPYRRRLTVTEHTLAMVIAGNSTPAGVLVANAWQGLEANVELLRVGIVDPTNVGDGTRLATLTLPTGATRTAYVHVTGMRVSSAEGADGVFSVLNAALTISIPTGRFA